MTEQAALEVKNLHVAYGAKQVVQDVSLKFPARQIPAMIGASGSGKPTVLRSLNRMNDDLATVTGTINFHGLNINQPDVNVYRVRQRIGMVFQQPTPFPLALSGGQQQRLCIARTLAVRPEIILMDEPTSALDPVSTSQIEETLVQLKEQFTIIMVTHNMQQASRSADWTAFMHQGRLVEFGPTAQIFMNPQEEQTADYLSGKFG